jgi:hypothetical protein
MKDEFATDFGTTRKCGLIEISRHLPGTTENIHEKHGVFSEIRTQHVPKACLVHQTTRFCNCRTGNISHKCVRVLQPSRFVPTHLCVVQRSSDFVYRSREAKTKDIVQFRPNLEPRFPTSNPITVRYWSVPQPMVHGLTPVFKLQLTFCCVCHYACCVTTRRTTILQVLNSFVAGPILTLCSASAYF